MAAQCCTSLIFYRGASMQGGLSHKQNNCQSVKRVNCDKTKESYAHILIPYERMTHPVFYRAACIVMRFLSVHPSVCLSVCHTRVL